MSQQDHEATGPLPIRWTDRANEDLLNIGDYISANNPGAAARWVAQLAADVERAAEFPRAGRTVPELGRDDIREVLRGNYRIVYKVLEDAIVVLTIFEGHRLLPQGIDSDSES